MSKGSPIVTMRIEAELLVCIEEAIVVRNAHSRNAPWNRSQFFMAAVKEKLAHMKRSRAKKKRKDEADALKGQGGEP